jgi:hypothetical protein
MVDDDGPRMMEEGIVQNALSHFDSPAVSL